MLISSVEMATALSSSSRHLQYGEEARGEPEWISFGVMIECFNKICLRMNLDRVTEQRCYQALLLMSSDSDGGSWTEKVNNPEKYLPDYSKRTLTKRLGTPSSASKTASPYRSQSSQSQSMNDYSPQKEPGENEPIRYV